MKHSFLVLVKQEHSGMYQDSILQTLKFSKVQDRQCSAYIVICTGLASTRPVFGKHSALPLLGESGSVWLLAGWQDRPELLAEDFLGLDGSVWLLQPSLAYVMFHYESTMQEGKSTCFWFGTNASGRWRGGSDGQRRYCCRSRLVCMMGPLLSTKKWI